MRNAFVRFHLSFSSLSRSLCQALTHDVEEGEELAEEISVRPEVVVLQVGVEVVDEQLLFLPLLHLGDDPQVEVHHEGGDLARLPVFPQPPRDVKEDRLKERRKKSGLSVDFYFLQHNHEEKQRLSCVKSPTATRGSQDGTHAT